MNNFSPNRRKSKAHLKTLQELKLCKLWGKDIWIERGKGARRAYKDPCGYTSFKYGGPPVFGINKGRFQISTPIKKHYPRMARNNSFSLMSQGEPDF